jgi:hypothetical protein
VTREPIFSSGTSPDLRKSSGSRHDDSRDGNHVHEVSAGQRRRNRCHYATPAKPIYPHRKPHLNFRLPRQKWLEVSPEMTEGGCVRTRPPSLAGASHPLGTSISWGRPKRSYEGLKAGSTDRKVVSQKTLVKDMAPACAECGASARAIDPPGGDI